MLFCCHNINSKFTGSNPFDPVNLPTTFPTNLPADLPTSCFNYQFTKGWLYLKLIQWNWMNHVILASHKAHWVIFSLLNKNVSIILFLKESIRKSYK